MSARDDAAATRPPCRNCGAGVEERYCSRCGQDREAGLASLREMARDFVDDQLGFSATLPRTLATLLLRPGMLTVEYCAGRLARYVRPLRLFLLSTLLFFLTLSLVTDATTLTRAGNVQWDESVQRPTMDAQGRPRWDNVNMQIDSAAVPGWMQPYLRRLEAAQDRMNSIPPDELVRRQLDAMIQAAARVAFLLAPLFALLLAGLHLRRRRLYAEHFVFALHFHAAGFLILTPALVVGRPAFWMAAFVLLVAHLLVALRRAYAQSWSLATLKALVILMVYPMVLSFGAGMATLVVLISS